VIGSLLCLASLLALASVAAVIRGRQIEHEEAERRRRLYREMTRDD
jgi:hypothetical protein